MSFLAGAVGGGTPIDPAMVRIARRQSWPVQVRRAWGRRGRLAGAGQWSC
jgi:hypothetical protein